MNTFRCSNCGFQIQRPTQPFSCPQCGRQAVGLFRVVAFTPPHGAPAERVGGWPGQPAMPQQPVMPQHPYPQAGQPGGMQPTHSAGAPLPQQGMPQQGIQSPPGGWPGQPQVPQPPVGPWGQPAVPQAPQGPGTGGWPGQPVMPQPYPQPVAQPQQVTQQPVIPQQGGWPVQVPPPASGWPGQPYAPTTSQPQQTMPQQPYPQVGAQPYPQAGTPPQGWPGGVQQPPGGQWPAQQGAQPTLPGLPAMPALPSTGQPGIPPQPFRPGIAPPTHSVGTPRFAGPLPTHSAGTPPPAPLPTQPVTPPTPVQGPPPFKPQNSGPSRTTSSTPPGVAKRPSPPAVPKPPEAPEARQRPPQPATPPTHSVGTPPAQPPGRKDAPVDRPPAHSVGTPTAPGTPPPSEPRPSSTVAPLPARPPAEASSSKPSSPPQPAETPRPRPAPVSAKPAAPKPVERPKKPRPEKLVWSFPEDVLPEEQAIPLRNAPAVDSGGRVFLQYRDRLVALVEEGKKPKLLWEYVIGTRAPGPVVLGPQDTLRLHCCDGYLHCLDALTGKQVWPPAAVGEPLGYAVPVVQRDGSTFVSGAEGGLVRVDPQGRVQKPQFFRSRKKFDSPAVLLDGVLYAGSELGYMFAIDVSGDRGANRWRQGGDHGYVGLVRSAPIVTPDKMLIVAGQDECLYGVATTGTLAWKTQLQGQILASPVTDRNGHIYVGLSQAPRGMAPRGALACLDGNSHKVRWEYRTDSPVESTPVIGDDDLIYFGDNAGVVHAIDFSGKGRWTADVGSPVRSAGTFLAPHRLAFGLDNDSLAVLECSSGGLAAEGWPKFGRTLGQNGVV